jgi:hypothetical protein
VQSSLPIDDLPKTPKLLGAKLQRMVAVQNIRDEKVKQIAKVEKRQKAMVMASPMISFRSSFAP